jgi:predicted porin
MDQITVNAVYESNKIAFSSGGDVKQTDIYLAGKFALSDTDAVKLAYTMKGATKTTGGDLKDKATQIAIGYDHAMSKNTTVYAMYAKQTWEDTLADPSTLSVGIKHSF